MRPSKKHIAPWCQRCATALICLTIISSSVTAQETAVWAVDGPADWNDDFHWELSDGSAGFVPDGAFDDSATINNGGTAVVSGAVPEIVNLNVGDGRLQIESGGDLGLRGDLAAGNAGRIHVQPGGQFNIGGSTVQQGRLVTGGSANVSVTGDWFHLGEWQTNLDESGNTPLQVGGVFRVSGNLEVQPQGFQPTLGQSWDLVQADRIEGRFSSVSPSNSGTPLERGLSYFVRADGQSATLEVDNALVLSVRRETGDVQISNVLGDPIDIKSYSVESANGLLSPSAWSSLQSQGNASWTLANPAPTHLAELNLPGSRIFEVGETLSLGNAYTGQTALPSQEDLVFTYTTADGEVVQGIVEYQGAANDLVLAVNPFTGEAQLRNLSTVIDTPDIKSYSILSESESLQVDSWNALAEQLGQESGWREARPTAGAISELNLASSAELSTGRSFDLGTVFDPDGTRDLRFVYSTVEGEVLEGTVEYVTEFATGTILGDFDGNGTVDLADFTLLKDNFGGSDAIFAAGSSNGDDLVDLTDFTLLKENFGASAAVPEPATLCLAGLAFATVLLGRTTRGRLRV